MIVFRIVGTAVLLSSAVVRAEEPPLWSHQPLGDPPVPTSQADEWSVSEVDRFVWARLEANGLAPSADAGPIALLRRLHATLTGLPPTATQSRSFLERVKANGLQAAVEGTVDELLESRSFAERWARHWLDVVRYAESSGRESNLTYPHAWRYRNYVIQSLHRDKPFDLFLREQIAGDLMPSKSDRRKAELMVATGFLAFGAKGLNEMNPIQFMADQIDEQIDTLSRAFLASSIACARCHDHKTDPFTMEDYYAMAGIFLSTETFFGTAISSENNVGGDLLTLPDLPDQVIPNASMSKAQVDKLKSRIAALNQEEKDRKAAAAKAVEEGRDPGEEFSLGDALRILWTRGGLEGQLETVADDGTALPLCMGAGEAETVRNAPLLHRGEIGQPRDEIQRGVPVSLQFDGVKRIGAEDSGRLELADWVTHPSHPLTARVLVNRVWKQVFGTGLVRTVDDFGRTGEPPSHPELLDHLARQWLKDGWSLKSMVRRLTTSRSFRQSSDHREEAFQADTDNRLLWRMPKRHLDAEVLRDSILLVAGTLDRRPPASSMVAPLGNNSVALFGFNKKLPRDLDGSRHRSIYLPVVRDRMPDAMSLFDVAEPSLVSGSRSETTVAPQALYLLNSPWIGEQATAMAGRVFQPDDASIDAGIRRAFRRCYTRPPSREELQDARRFLGESGEVERQIAFCQALLISNEFRYLD